MQGDFEWPAIVVVILIASTCLIYGTAAESREAGYRQGQIDAANGIVKYELKQLPTGETVWKKKAGE